LAYGKILLVNHAKSINDDVTLMSIGNLKMVKIG
jgi:hypothetical protein